MWINLLQILGMAITPLIGRLLIRWLIKIWRDLPNDDKERIKRAILKFFIPLFETFWEIYWRDRNGPLGNFIRWVAKIWKNLPHEDKEEITTVIRNLFIPLFEKFWEIYWQTKSDKQGETNGEF